MYIKLIPSLRLPRSLDQFDYILPETLAEQVKPGTIVRVQFRRQPVMAVVWSIMARTQIKPAQLKTVQGVVQGVTFSPIQRQLVERFAQEFLVAPGTVVNMIIGDLPRRGLGEPLAVPKPTRPRRAKSSWQPDALVWHRTEAEKIAYLTKLVHTAQRLHKHILLVSPEIRQVRAWETALQSFKPLVIHRQLPPSLYWQRFADLSKSQPTLVIGTRSALFLPHQRLDVIVIDAEDNPNHRQTEMNPRYHTEQVARLLQSIAGTNIIWVSQAPRLSTWHAYRQNQIKLVDIRAPRPTLKVLIEDMSAERKLGNRAMLSERLQRLVAANLKSKRLSVLYLNRRGESTGFVCRDCGHGFNCPRCQRPLVLHRNKTKEQVLNCHLCEFSIPAPTNCPICRGTEFKKSGWRLQLLESDVRALFPEATIAIREAGSQPVPAGTDIIIGTQIVLTPSILAQAGLFAFVSVDQLLALPDFSAPEQAFRQMSLAVAGISSDATLVFQTFKPDQYAVRFGAAADLDGFYQVELTQRAMFHYPPHTDIVRLIIKGKTQKQTTRDAEEVYGGLMPKLHDLPGVEMLHPSPSFVAKTRGLYRWELVLKYPPDRWPEIRDLLQLINDRWLIDVQPQSLL